MTQKQHIIQMLRSVQGERVGMPTLRQYRKKNGNLGRISSFTARVSEARKIVEREGLYIYESEVRKDGQRHTFYKLDVVGKKQDKPSVCVHSLLGRFKNFLRLG